MIATLIIQQLPKLIELIQYRNKAKRVIRIYDIDGEKIPEKILEETIPDSGIFRDKVNNIRIIFTDGIPKLA